MNKETELKPEWKILEEKYRDICIMWACEEGVKVSYFDSHDFDCAATFDVDDIDYAIECLENAKADYLRPSAAQLQAENARLRSALEYIDSKVYMLQSMGVDVPVLYEIQEIKRAIAAALQHNEEL
jgi:hypothetical protein